MKAWNITAYLPEHSHRIFHTNGERSGKAHDEDKTLRERKKSEEMFTRCLEWEVGEDHN